MILNWFIYQLSLFGYFICENHIWLFWLQLLNNFTYSLAAFSFAIILWFLFPVSIVCCIKSSFNKIMDILKCGCFNAIHNGLSYISCACIANKICVTELNIICALIMFFVVFVFPYLKSLIGWRYCYLIVSFNTCTIWKVKAKETRTFIF